MPEPAQDDVFGTPGEHEGAWLSDLDLWAYTITLVRDLEPQAALQLIGGAATQLQHVDVPSADELADQSNRCVLAIGGLGLWTMLLEPGGAAAIWEAADLSQDGREAVVARQGPNAEEQFSYWRDGKEVFTAGDPDTATPEVDPQPDPDEPLAALIQRLDQAGHWGEHQSEEYPPDVALACLVAGVSPRPTDMAGQHLAATFPHVF